MQSVGLKIRSGFAIAVVVERHAGQLSIAHCQVVSLSSESQSRFPFHPTIELPPRRGDELSSRAVADVRSTAKREMAAFLKRADSAKCAGIVVGSVADPQSIGSPHIRAHAREGQLFREVVTEALQARGIRVGVLIEKQAYERAASDLARPAAALRTEIAALGHKRVKPWRTEEKLATLAACWQLGLLDRPARYR